MKLEYRAILRNIRTNGVYSALSLLGLAIGFVASSLLILNVLDELSFDENFVPGGPIFTINTRVVLDGSEFTTATGPAPLANVLKTEIPDVIDATRLVKHRRVVVRNNGDKYFEEGFFYAESNIAKFFTYTVIDGDAGSFLDAPNSIVLTRSVASKYFGEESAQGRTLEIDGNTYRITGVISDPTTKAHFVPRAFISYSTLDANRNTVWASLDDHTYLRLRDKTQRSTVESALPSIPDKYAHDIYARFNAKVSFHLQPLEQIHFGERLREIIDVSRLGSRSDIYLSIVVALLIIILASANYAILTVAASIKRAKEIGIRKILGAYRSQLIAQQLFETMTTVLIVFLTSALATWFLTPLFASEFLGGASLSTLVRRETIWFAIGIFLIISVVCAGYPAWYLSVFEPAVVVKSGATDKLAKIPFKAVLLFIQLSLVGFMLSSMWILFDQFNLTRKIDLGFNPARILKLELPNDLTIEQYQTLRNNFMAVAGVADVASATAVPGGQGFDSNSFMIQKNDGGFELMVTTNFRVSQDYAHVTGLTMKTGRFFSDDHPSDESAVIVNEALVRQFGWTEPLGKRMEKIINQNMDKEYYTVIGIVKDFHLHGLHETTAPAAMLYRKLSPVVLVKLNKNFNAELINQLSKIWQLAVASQPFEVRFLQDALDVQYREESNKAKVFAVFTLLCLVIAFVGLFGIVSYDCRQRGRELALRLLLGATSSNIAILLNRYYLRIVIGACAVGLPVSYYVMTFYLDKFAYRVSIDGLPFLTATVVICMITVATVVWHVRNAVTKNPVELLRQE